MSSIKLPMPIATDETTVTLSRASWEALIKQIDNAEDLAAADRHASWMTAVGPEQTRGLCYTDAETDQILVGTPMLVIWRGRAGLSQKALAEKAGVSTSYLADIEGGKKPGSVAAMSALAKALDVPLEMLVD